MHMLYIEESKINANLYFCDPSVTITGETIVQVLNVQLSDPALVNLSSACPI